MKAVFAAVLAALATSLNSQAQAATNTAEPPVSSPATDGSRREAGLAAIPETPAVNPQGAIATPPPEIRTESTAPPVTADPAPGSPPMSQGRFDWGQEGVELRMPAIAVPRTNLAIESVPVLPKLTRPERRGFGGFVAAFANLFNPFAPVEQGVASRPAYWYDATIRPDPLPRGMRDERYHEPRTELLVFGLDGEMRRPERGR